jgi:integrase
MLATGEIVTVTKRGRVVKLPITPRIAALAALSRPTALSQDCRYIDLLNNRVVVQGKSTMNERWNRWKKQAGLPPDLRIHDLRRDLAHRLYKTSGDVRQVQGALGHESPITTMRYLHLAAPEVQPSAISQALIQE